MNKSCLNKVSKSEGQGKLNGHIVYESALLIVLSKIMKISLSLSKLQVSNVGAFFETQ